jgi:hypothetical protein
MKRLGMRLFFETDSEQTHIFDCNTTIHEWLSDETIEQRETLMIDFDSKPIPRPDDVAPWIWMKRVVVPLNENSASASLMKNWHSEMTILFVRKCYLLLWRWKVLLIMRIYSSYTLLTVLPCECFQLDFMNYGKSILVNLPSMMWDQYLALEM